MRGALPKLSGSRTCNDVVAFSGRTVRRFQKSPLRRYLPSVHPQFDMWKHRDGHVRLGSDVLRQQSIYIKTYFFGFALVKAVSTLDLHPIDMTQYVTGVLHVRICYEKNVFDRFVIG